VIDRLVVATQNPDKLAEIEAVLIDSGVVGELAQGLSWPEIEETEPTLEGNARLKARTVSELTGLPALADDTGLGVAALGGAPGVRTARFSGPGATYASNRAALLAALDGVTDRSAVFRTVMCVAWPTDGGEVVAAGELEGMIALEERGSEGFGYDAIFEVEGRTLAEWGHEAKLRFSHRTRAIQALARALGSQQ
jgi:XTP/dITP diphosphohydrolase